jgi:hypothetical protein
MLQLILKGSELVFIELVEVVEVVGITGDQGSFSEKVGVLGHAIRFGILSRIRSRLRR